MAGGDGKTFEEITKAYEVLSDPKRRAKYDEDGTILKDPNQEKMEELMKAFGG